MVVCDKIPDEDPAHDMTDIIDDYKSVEYLINPSLHEIISAARQAPGIFIEA